MTVLASALAYIEKEACILSVLARIIISYIPNTNKYMPIHAVMYYVLACTKMHTNKFPSYLACIVASFVVCNQSVFASIKTFQYFEVQNIPILTCRNC